MSVCIQVINPNTSLAMTETIGAAAPRGGGAGNGDPRGLSGRGRAVYRRPL